MGGTGPFWSFSAASYPDLEGTVPSGALLRNTSRMPHNGNPHTSSRVQDLTQMPFAERELMLLKVAVNATARRDVLDIISIFRAQAVDVSDHTITVEVKSFARLCTDLMIRGLYHDPLLLLNFPVILCWGLDIICVMLLMDICVLIFLFSLIIIILWSMNSDTVNYL